MTRLTRLPGVALLPFTVTAMLTGGGCAPDETGPTWTPLITDTWALEPGTENTSKLSFVALDRDITVGAIRPIDPPGTHHTVLARGMDLTSANIIYASGVGTNELSFPPGVGLRLPRGTLLTLQLHVFNTTESNLSGLSGVEVIEIPDADVIHEADLFLPGPMHTISLPPGKQTTISGDCTITTPHIVFALFPHMHQLGVHFRTKLTVGGGVHVLHDAPYYFDEQAFLRFDPIDLNPGDLITTECTWNNTSAQVVGWGESSKSEMCFSILYRYPVAADSLCTQ